jgi:flagellar biosynthesis regulator FlaF
MDIDLDPQALRHLMASWRMATDIELAMDDRLKIELIARRGEILAKFIVTARAWLVLLRNCCEHDDADELPELREDVNAFSAWAQKELEALRRLRQEESVLDE